MLHPALTRVMAVVLAILCLILFFASYFGLDDAEELRADDIAAHNKLTERIAVYEELSKKLEDKETYKQADEKLSEQEEEHDSAASQHRTDLATHTAKEGGYKQGADALWEAKAQLDEKKPEYYAALEEFNKQQARFDQIKAIVESLSKLIEAFDNSSQLQPVSDPGPAPMQPQPPVAPLAVSEPMQPQPFILPLPNEADYPDNPDAYQAALAEYNQAKAGYDAQMALYNQAKADYDAYPEKQASYEAELYLFTTELLPAYEAALAEHTSAAKAYQDYSSAINGLMQRSAPILNQLGISMPDSFPSLGGVLRAAYDYVLQMLEEGEAALAEGKVMLEEAGKAIELAEGQIQGNLENIWYNMGKLEDEAKELAIEKEELTENSAQLQQDRETLEQQKEDENKLRSTRILLMQNKRVEDLVDAGGGIAESSKQYADEFKADYEKNYQVRRVLCFIAMTASILGILGLPAAFELLRSRVLLLVPAYLSLLCAGAAEFLSVRSGEGQFYTAIPVIIFAFLYLLSASPRKKVIRE